MTYLRQPRHREARRPRIHFPRMDVKDPRNLGVGILPKPLTSDRVRELPEVSTPSGGDLYPRYSRHRQRKFDEIPPVAMNEMRNWWRLGIPIIQAPNRKQTRIIAIPSLQEHVEGPFEPRRDRKARGAIPHNRLAAHLFQNRSRRMAIFPKLLSRERRHLPVPPPMRRNLVPGVDNSANQLRVLLGDPPKREESPRRGMPLQELEDDFRVPDDPGGVPIPLGSVDHAFEGVDLEVIFNVDSKNVFNR